MDEDRERSQTRPQEQQEPENPKPAEQQGKGPFLRQMRQVERQGVPEAGAIDPGPPPKPVRSGDFHAGPAAPQEQGEEQ